MSHIAIDARIVNSSSGRYVERLLHYLQEVDTVNRYTILVPFEDKDYFIPTAENFVIQVANYDNFSFAEQLGFKRYLDELEADLVHFCMPQQPILYKGTHVTTFHDLTILNVYNSDKNWLIFHAKQLVGKFVFRRVAHTSAELIVPTQYVADDLIAYTGVDPDKVTVTYEAAEVPDDKPKEYELPYEQFIMYVGRQSDYKNIKRLAAAHQRLIKKYPDLGLVLVGSKNASIKINEAYFTEKNYKNITFTGFLPDTQLNWLYRKASAYVFASLSEGFGLPALEAMGHGTPVVSSNATCLPEVYGDAAHYFDPTDVTDMARAIDEVLSSENLRKKLIEKGYERFKKYSWRKMAKETHEVYMKALGTTSLPEQS